MDLDPIVEQLAFGRSVPKFKSCLGLYLSPDVLFLSEVHVVGGKPVIDHLLRIPYSSGSSRQETSTRHAGSLNTEMLSDAEKIAGLLKQAMGQMRWGSKYLMVSLSHNFGLVRYFTMPGIERRFWKTAVNAEAKKYIPIPFEELTTGFQVVSLSPGPDKRARLGVLFGVTHKKIMQGLRGLAEKMGLVWVGLEVSPCSVERLWDIQDVPSGAPPSAHVYVEGVSVRILLSENGIPIFFREVQLGDEAGNLDRRRLDLSGSIDFTRKQLAAQKPAQVRVEGLTQDINGWKEVLGQETGLPVQVRDTAKSLGLKAGEWGGYASIGSALRYLAPTRILMSVGSFGQASDEDRRAARVIFSVGGILTAIFLLLGGLCQGLALLKSYQLAKFSKDVSTAGFQGKTADEIQRMLQDMEKKVNSLSLLAGSRHKTAKILENLSDIVPDSLWLGSLSYTAAMGGGGLSNMSRALSLKGFVSGPDAMSEQDMAIQFRQKLINDPDFGGSLTCGGVSVQTEAKASSGGAAQNIASGKGNRTSFTLECMDKTGFGAR